ncbi:hypothetical protein FACS189419_02730 [Planctomycetales bacterium]|nr:hypothetical protein FACS189419_02730 [Planctomycetales bacterium]
MTAIRTFFDGTSFIPLEPVMLQEQKEVLITLPEPKSASGLLDFFGIWSQEDLDTMQSIIEERQIFSERRAD